VTPDDATGVVLVDIAGKGYYANVTDGKATVTVEGLKEGTYTAKVTYLGDDRYANSTAETIFTVSAPIEVEVEGDGNSPVIEITLPGDATGNVTVQVDGKNYTSPIEDGKAKVNLSGVTPGEHNITVIYSGDRDHEGTETTQEITVPKYSSPITVDVKDGLVGDTTKVTVNVPEGATGDVTVEIDGKSYTSKVKDGKATFDINGLKAGDKTIIAAYSGDEDYEDNTTTATFSIAKRGGADVKVAVDDIKVGENATVKVTVPEDATGYAIVEVDGVEYGVNLTEGEGSVEIPGLKAGSHDIKVTYLGDDKYEPAFESSKVNVAKEKPAVDVKAENITKDSADVKVTLPDDATGTITVDVDGKKTTVPAKPGENTVHIPNLDGGKHNVTVTYSGDDQYDRATKSITVTIDNEPIGTVIRAEKAFERLATDYFAGERGGIFYAYLFDTNGNRLANKEVQVAVNGPIYTVTTDENGGIPVQINLMNANIYTYAIFFQGDGTYKASHMASSKLTVVKKSTSIQASNQKFKASAKTKVVKVTLKTVKNPFDGKTYLKTGKKLTLKVDGKTYKAKIDKNGVAKFKVQITKKGKYTAKVSFAGDNTYEASSAKIKITIK